MQHLLLHHNWNEHNMITIIFGAIFYSLFKHHNEDIMICIIKNMIVNDGSEVTAIRSP